VLFWHTAESHSPRPQPQPQQLPTSMPSLPSEVVPAVISALLSAAWEDVERSHWLQPQWPGAGRDGLCCWLSPCWAAGMGWQREGL